MAMRGDLMECTGGFKALRKHVKYAKDGGAAQSERDQEWDDTKSLLLVECTSEARDNQDRFSQEERDLNLIRISLAKEQREIKTRERSVKAMETALQEAMDRTAEKERNLDQRIQGIAQLEQRLHEALIATLSSRADTPEKEATRVNQDDLMSEETRRKLEERETAIVLREQELTMARERVADRERHLSTKERVLRDKATELTHLQSELETKDAQRSAQAHSRLNELEHELQKQYKVHEQELLERFQAQLASLNSEFEAKRDELEEQTTAAKAKVQQQLVQVEKREEIVRLSEISLASSQTTLQNHWKNLALTQERTSMMGEDAVSRTVQLETQRGDLLKRTTEADALKGYYEDEAMKLKHQEAKLALFAAEVEAQSQFNAIQRHQLEADRAAFDLRLAAKVVKSTVAVQTTDTTRSESSTISEPLQDSRRPLAKRSFTTTLFRNKSTTRLF